jgi:XTP/dITP diphosphohydrolase
VTAAPNTHPRLVLATNNPGKVRELRRLLEGAGFDIATPAELGIALDVDETGTTYAENALLKARAFANASGLLALADDSGIEVDALDGRPGVYSARYGGPALDDEGRTALLLHELEGIPREKRTARYRAIVALAWPALTPNPSPTAEGEGSRDAQSRSSVAAADAARSGFANDVAYARADSPLPAFEESGTGEGPGVRELVFEGVQEGTIAHAPRGSGGFGYDPVFLVDGLRTQAEIPADEKDRISHRGQAARAACEYLRSLPR